MTLSSLLAEGKTLPPEVNDPLVQLLKWGLGLGLILILAALIAAGGQFYSRRQSGDADLGDAGANVGWILIGAIIATSASAIAIAVMV